MSEKKSSKNNACGIAAGITMIASVVPLVKPAIDAIREYTDKMIEERRKLVVVPELYSKEYPLSVEQAVELLESCGLKSTLVKMSIADADARYRNCFDSQVIKSHPKAKQKVERGTGVLLKYITQEVIDESQRMFELDEKRKEELSLEKSVKQAEQKDKAKRVVSDVIGTVQNGFKKVPSVFHKTTEKEEQDEQE